MFKHAHAPAERAESLAIDSDLGRAFDNDKDHFAITRRLGCAFPRLEAIKTKSDVAPIGTFRCDVVHLAGGSRRLSQQIGHQAPPLSSPVFLAIWRRDFSPSD